MFAAVGRHQRVGDQRNVLAHLKAAAARTVDRSPHQAQGGRRVAFEQRQHAALVLVSRAVEGVVRVQGECGLLHVLPRAGSIDRGQGDEHRLQLDVGAQRRQQGLGVDQRQRRLRIGAR